MFEAFKSPEVVKRIGTPLAFLQLSRVSVDEMPRIRAEYENEQRGYAALTRMRRAQGVWEMQRDSWNKMDGLKAALDHEKTFSRRLQAEGRVGPLRFNRMVPFS